MAKLTTTVRKSLPDAQFGLPASRKFPMPDRSHAANAKSRAAQGVKAGTLSKSQAGIINAKANKVLGKS